MIRRLDIIGYVGAFGGVDLVGEPDGPSRRTIWINTDLIERLDIQPIRGDKLTGDHTAIYFIDGSLDDVVVKGNADEVADMLNGVVRLGSAT